MKPVVDLATHIRQRLQRIEQQGLLRTKRISRSLGNGRIVINDREMWDFSSNDYLGFATDSIIQQQVAETLPQTSLGARASLLISGWTSEHQRLADRLCEFEAVEDVLLFSSGYAACMGAISSLVDAADIVFCDRLNHACLVDGCRLSGSRLRIFRHDRLETLERELKKTLEDDSQPPHFRWIVTESLFGMDGAPADLKQLVDLAETYNAWIICDEAHATGVYGPGGRGLVTQLMVDHPEDREKIERRVAVRLGTLSKAFGSQGGFAAGSAEMIQLLWNTARPAMFSTGISVMNCLAARFSVEKLIANPDLPVILRESSRKLRQQLSEIGLENWGAEDCPIIPLVLEDPQKAIEWGQQLQTDGIFVGTVRPPTVPYNTSRLRISVNRLQPDEAQQQLMTSLQRLQQKVPA